MRAAAPTVLRFPPLSPAPTGGCAALRGGGGAAETAVPGLPPDADVGGCWRCGGLVGAAHSSARPSALVRASDSTMVRSRSMSLTARTNDLPRWGANEGMGVYVAVVYSERGGRAPVASEGRRGREVQRPLCAEWRRAPQLRDGRHHHEGVPRGVGPPGPL